MSVLLSAVPAGFTVKFQSHSPRAYWITDGEVNLREAETVDWGKKLDSVTGVLRVLDKPALPWWGMEVGLEGLLACVAKGALLIDSDGGWEVVNTDQWNEIVKWEAKEWPDGAPEKKQLSKLLTLNKLTTNHVRNRAGKRGQNAHDAFEAYCESGIIPAPRAYPPEEQGYVKGLVAFLAEHDLQTESTEMIVGSRIHKVGGRYDGRGALDGVSSLVDVKTSKNVNTPHFIQLEAYEGMSVESGYEPTQRRVVVHLRPDGTYNLVEAKDVSVDGEPCTYEDWLSVLDTHRRVKRLGGL